MKRFFESWFVLPYLTDDEEKKRRLYLLYITTNASIIFNVLVLVGNFLGGRASPCLWVVDFFALAATLVLRRLLQKGKTMMGGAGLVLIGFFVITMAIYSLGTIRTPTTTTYVVVVIVAGMLFGVRGLVVWTGVVSLAIFLLMRAELSGALPPADLTVSITQWVTFTVLFALIGILTYIVYQSAQKAFNQKNQVSLERYRAQENLRASELRFRALFEQSNDAVFIIALDGRHLMWNRRATEMLGYAPEEMDGLTVSQVTAEPDLSDIVLAQMLAGKTVPLFERKFRKKDGQIFPVEINVQLVYDEQGQPLHIQSVVRDISRRKQDEAALRYANEQLNLRIAEVEDLQAELREQALRDPLTGLYNRRYMGETLQREMARAAREQIPLSVIVADLDWFKHINDTWGHSIGDRFLVDIACLLIQNIRESDVVCRYGGEEFVMVLPGTPLPVAAERAEQIRRRVAQIQILHQGTPLSITMSLGVAAFPEHGSDGMNIVSKADQAQYLSKRAGRNRVTVWSDAG